MVVGKDNRRFFEKFFENSVTKIGFWRLYLLVSVGL